MARRSAFAANERFDNRHPRHTDTDYYLHDILGSVVGVTDERGNQREEYCYDVWGNRYDRPPRNNGNRYNSAGWNAVPATLFGFNGKRFDPKVGLYDYGFRDYKPEVSRWTTVDPIRDGRNWYAYVENDPVNLRDLWGLEVLIEQIIEGIVDIAAGSTIVTGAAVVEYFSGGLASPGVVVAVMGGVSQISYGIAEIATAFYGNEIPSSTDLLLEVASYGFAETGFDPPSVEVKEGN
ncbi:RHS repeat-associated core domain-containing protein [Marispirochaeta sp.]|uniref:RHS repeat-associated core domain-containing protein n=1 Tax=Marispirochaeta sp. TaxID=2038653 RepID=UPI0029C74082|nr:RHS repeat-associated core domain-containing protein [Marispirochaeta sp.]